MIYKVVLTQFELVHTNDSNPDTAFTVLKHTSSTLSCVSIFLLAFLAANPEITSWYSNLDAVLHGKSTLTASPGTRLTLRNCTRCNFDSDGQ